MRPFIGIALLLLASCGPSNSATEEKKPSPFLWELRGHGNLSYLFGTIHLTDPRVTTLHPKVKEAINGSSAVFLEVEPKHLKPEVFLQLGRLPKGESLKDTMPEATYKKLRVFFAKKGVKIETVNLRPWLITLQILTPLLKSECGENSPKKQNHDKRSLDLEIASFASNLRKEMGGLENPEDQVEALSAGCTKAQCDQIDQILDRLSNKSDDEPIKKSPTSIMIDAYLSGDLNRIEKDIIQAFTPGMTSKSEQFQTVLTRRNIKWASKIDQRMMKAQSKPTFYAVGCGHFIGAEGLQKLLRQKGYSVRRIY